MKFLTLAIIALTASLIGCNNDSNDIGNREIFIDHYKSECFGLALSLCMRSRVNSDDDWSLFYESIDGFDYEWGYVYKLRVNISNIENPPEDASSVKYTLVDMLSKELESNATTFNIAASRSTGLVVNKSAGVYELYSEKEFSCTTAECVSIESLITQDLAILFEFTHNETLNDPMQLSQVKCSDSRDSFRESCL